MTLASKRLSALALGVALSGVVLADDPPGTKRGGEKPGAKSAEGDGQKKALGETVALTGAVSKEEGKKKRDDGSEVVVTNFYLTETKGNKVLLPNPRTGDGGSKTSKVNPAEFVGKQVTLTGQAVTAPAREGSSTKRVVRVVAIAEMKEVSK